MPWELRLQNWTTNRKRLSWEMVGRCWSGGARNDTDVAAWPNYLPSFQVASHQMWASAETIDKEVSLCC